MASAHEANMREQEIQRSIAASDMYRLLFMALHFPTSELALALLDGSFTEDVMAIFEELNFSAAEMAKIKTGLIALQGDQNRKDELLTQMRREYTRLFTHPKNPVIAIYETTFRYDPEDELASKPALFISPAALDAERCYKKAGLMMSREINEPADHMATEMEFMMYLYLQKVKGLREDNQEERVRREEEIEEFREAHLQKWAKDFFDRCSSASQNDAYRVIGEIGSLYMARMLAV